MISSRAGPLTDPVKLQQFVDAQRRYATELATFLQRAMPTVGDAIASIGIAFAAQAKDETEARKFATDLSAAVVSAYMIHAARKGRP